MMEKVGSIASFEIGDPCGVERGAEDSDSRRDLISVVHSRIGQSVVELSWGGHLLSRPQLPSPSW